MTYTWPKPIYFIWEIEWVVWKVKNGSIWGYPWTKNLGLHNELGTLVNIKVPWAGPWSGHKHKKKILSWSAAFVTKYGQGQGRPYI